jgi:CRP-like cAMP-binding protein
VLHEAGENVDDGYFMESGMTSILTVMEDGTSVEVGLVGKEGFIGTAILAGFRITPTRAITQAAGGALRVKRAELEKILAQCPRLQFLLNRYAQVLAVQTSQAAACNRLHNLEERLARWLLMSQDRINSDVLPLTHDFLAQMLGTRRSSVTIAAGILHKAGLIEYRRGQVAILDRAGLEKAACECYAAVQQFNHTSIGDGRHS